MSLDVLKDRLPAEAKDLKLNLSSLAGETLLTPQQKAGTFLATAIAARNKEVQANLWAEFAPTLSEEALAAVKTAAALLSMNNIYYRFLHLSSAPDYKTLPARLRMNGLANPGVEKADFELWALAVSAINGCGMCIDAHEKTLRQHGLSLEQIQAAVRIAATVFAVSVTLDLQTSAERHSEAA